MQTDQRWAVILGVSTGTGAAIAPVVARRAGLNVFGVHRGNYQEDADRVAAAVRATEREAVFHRGDAGSVDGVRDCVAALRAVAPPRSVAFLVHSLAGASIGHFLSTRGDAFHPKQFEKTFSVMAHSFAYWAQALHEQDMLAPSSRLLGLTNVLHESLLHNCGLIAAAKAALEMYVRYLAIELGPLGHRVNLLKFSTVITPALRTMLGPEAVTRLEGSHREMIPAQRMCTFEEVADFVAVLLREDTAWINGATIDFTGGQTLRLLDMILRPA